MPTNSNPDLPSNSDRTQPPEKSTASKPTGRPPRKEEGGWQEIAKTIGLSLLLAMGIRQFVAEARYIPSESMVPTLLVNDRLIVEKVSYRFHSPERGDIVVFIPPESASQYCLGPQSTNIRIKDAFIKRVVALPGETVEVREGKVFINNQPLQENYIAEPPDYTMAPTVIPADSVLVLGDNRNNSCDGHFWGPVPDENIIGKAVFRFWPPNRIGGIALPPGQSLPAAPPPASPAGEVPAAPPPPAEPQPVPSPQPAQ